MANAPWLGFPPATTTGADGQGAARSERPADGVATVVATSVGGSPTTTYAENTGVMAATRVYSTAAYVVAAGIAILFGLSPKFGSLVAATRRRRLGDAHRGHEGLDRVEVADRS